MPRPAGVNLDEIFGPKEPPAGWEQRVDYQMYFVHGLEKALTKVGVRPNRKLFLPLRDEVVRERRNSNWETALLADTWNESWTKSQVNRFVYTRNNTFTTAASGVLAIELLLQHRAYGGDIYRELLVYVVAQDSFITELTHDMFSTLCERVRTAEGRPWQDCICMGQRPEVFYELVSGRLVTRGLADEILVVIKRYLPNFNGRVSSDFNARRESLQKLRQDAYDADGKDGQKKYYKKITGAQTETYAG
jgi:hypothetical protein